MAGESLRVVAGKAAGKEIDLNSEFLIGRAAEQEGKLGDDPEISRSHARISRRAGDQLAIEDLGSTNGTFVNGKRIEGAQVLSPGDTIKVGTTTLQVLSPEGDAPQATAFSPTQPEPGAQATKATPTPPPPPPAAPAPGAPAAGPPTPPPPPPPAPPGAAPGGPSAPPTQAGPPGGPPTAPPPTAPPSGRRGGFPVIPALIGGLVLLAIIVVAVVLLAGGGDEDKTLSTKEVINENKRAVARVDTRTPGFENGKKVSKPGGGSGIVVDAAKGYVLTNQHVIAGATSVKATVGGTESNARVLGQAPCEDLAVLEMSPKPSGLKAATLGSASSVSSGDDVTAMGYPGSFESSASERRLQGTKGTVSSAAAPGTISDDLPKYPALIQHTAPISPGNSGGALFNNKGEVVGVNTIGSTGSSQNQNGAISMTRARSLLPDLEAGRDSGYVGWQLSVLDASQIESIVGANLDKSGKTLVVISVDANSPAEKAKLVTADTVEQVDDTPVSTYADVCDIIGSHSSGDRLKISGETLFASRYFNYTVRARLK